MKDFYEQHYKMLQKGIKTEKNSWRDIPINVLGKKD